MKNKKYTYKVITRSRIPDNWVSGRPRKLFGIFLFIVWEVAKEGYPWKCNKCFERVVRSKHDLCTDCLFN